MATARPLSSSCASSASSFSLAAAANGSGAYGQQRRRYEGRHWHSSVSEQRLCAARFPVLEVQWRAKEDQQRPSARTIAMGASDFSGDAAVITVHQILHTLTLQVAGQRTRGRWDGRAEAPSMKLSRSTCQQSPTPPKPTQSPTTPASNNPPPTHPLAHPPTNHPSFPQQCAAGLWQVPWP